MYRFENMNCKVDSNILAQRYHVHVYDLAWNLTIIMICKAELNAQTIVA